MKNEAIITQFYQAFSNNNIEKMLACYHDEVTFEDPAFGKLEGEQAKNMWRMLLLRGGDTMKVTFDNVKSADSKGSANWIAVYEYGEKKRKVTNNVQANFEFKDGKIIKHVDHFDLWKWTQQALGVSGYLLGWSSFMKGKIQQQTNGLLRKFEGK
jgi:ketosteroid isomerase-like protein